MPVKSSVHRLPPEVRTFLERALADGRMTLDELVQALRERWPDADTPSRSAVHRYGQRLESRLAAIRASTEAARIIAETAEDREDLASAAVIRLVQSELFEALVALQDAGLEDDQGERLELLSKAARAVADVSRASQGQKRWQEQARQRAAETAERVEQRAKAAGLSPVTIAAIRADILGIV